MSIPLSRRPVRLFYLFIIFSLGTFLFYRQSNTFANWPGGSGFHNSVHRYKNADEFLSHIASIPSIRNLTIAEAQEACTWSEQELKHVNFQWTGDQVLDYDTSWIQNGWDEKKLDVQRAELEKFLKTGLVPYRKVKARLDNGGIVIVAGNGLSLAWVKVILRQLRRLGSIMPVELHYWGGEVTGSDQAELTQLWAKIKFNDLSGPHNLFQTSYLPAKERVNYNLKPAALLNSGFQQILMLDSDNIPVIKPEDLFTSKTYREFGTVFWPDIARTRPNNPIWALSKTSCQMDEYEHESGQMLVDKRRFWYHLQLAMYFLDDFHWKFYGSLILGDKDAFRFAWKTLRTQYGTPSRWLSSVGFSVKSPDSAEHFFCGMSFAQYHPDKSPGEGRIAFLHANAIKTQPTEVLQWLKSHAGGPLSHIKKSPHEDDPSYNFQPKLKFDGHSYIPESQKPAELKVGTCMDLPDVEARPLTDVIEGGFEDVYEKIGGLQLPFIG